MFTLTEHVSGTPAGEYRCIASNPLGADTSRAIVVSVRESTVYYVDSAADASGDGLTWASAFADLQQALGLAQGGDQVWVAKGTYFPSRDTACAENADLRLHTFRLRPSVKLYGGFEPGAARLADRDPWRHLTVLSGDIGTRGVDSDNVCHVLCSFGCDTTARLDGFVVRDGRSEQSDAGWIGLGAGMYNDGSSPTITACVFRDNKAYEGAGMCGLQSSPVLDTCIFLRNIAVVQGGGMLNRTGSHPTLSRCRIDSNTAQAGGGICNSESSSPTLTGCTFDGNTASYGGGLCNNISSSPSVTNCAFTHNTANATLGGLGYGGGMHSWNECSATITGCSFVANNAVHGGAMSNGYSSSPVLMSCAFDTNTALGKGGGMHNYTTSGPTLTNCTFTQNTAGEGGGMHNEQSSPTLTNCTFEGNVVRARPGEQQLGGGGVANLNASPTLVGCIFSGNTADIAGGLANGGSSPNLTNCVFSANVARVVGGGLTNASSSPSLVNCIFNGNTADQAGGGMFNSEASPHLVNCTFSSNTAAGSVGGGICNTFSSHPVLANGLLWDSPIFNQPAEAGVEASETALHNTVCLAGNSNCPFVDAPGPDGTTGTADDDLRVDPGSATADRVIDTGDNSKVPAEVSTDLAGNPRIMDGDGDGTATVDPGAYEYQVQ
ncbi:MAG: hypothetical protein GF331_15205 [Chitinivibrionales bacterium]|nr:hypothetical protein [Chitinivibrionales bacterium]